MSQSQGLTLSQNAKIGKNADMVEKMMCKAPPWPECDECLADDKVACLQHVGKSLVSCRPGSQRPLSIPMESHHGLDLDRPSC